MKIGINSQYQIKQIRNITDAELIIIELDETIGSYPFKNFTDEKILCYCYENNGKFISFYPYINTDKIADFESYTSTLNSMISDRQNIINGLIRVDALSEENVITLIDFYTEYKVGTVYSIGDIFKHEGNLFEVIQAHTSQADWLPLATKSLYKCKTPSLVIPNWIQPVGGYDAYNIGNKVIFNGLVYESTINANVWSPTAYPAGWKLV